MSTGTDTDTSSNVRQFGLYRSIDARTEEFLKLSRKRQIKQGCACAAISTVVTVAVVIIIILIYEYSMIPDSQRKTTLSQNWISLMNTTVDAVPFEVKLNKAKLSLNPSTIQILPLILKALKKNIYFENIIEDPTSSRPQYEKKELAEEVYTRNIFSDKKNWMRMPTSRLYAIEYKNSPIIYLRSPTRSIDYFTKIRKIRDYERVMNYVDKMISEKVSLGTTIPMGKNKYAAFKKPNIEFTTPMAKVDKVVKKKKKIISKKHKTTATQTDVQSNCNCPKRMNDILSKFINRLKNILPNLVKEIKGTKLCNHNKNHTTKEIINSKALESQREVTSKVHADIEHNLTDTKYSSTVKISPTTYKSNADQSYYNPVTFESKEDFNFKPKDDFIKSTEGAQNTNEYHLSYPTTIKKQYYQDFESTFNFEETTISPKAPTEPMKYITTVKDYITERTTNVPKDSVYYPKFTEKDYDDYKDSTPNIFDYFKFLDAHSLELVKKFFASNKKNVDDIKDTINHTKNLDINSSTYKSQTTETSKTSTTETTTSGQFTGIATETSIQTTSLDAPEKEKGLDKIKTYQTIKTDDITLDEEIIKESTDYTESAIKRFDNEMQDFNYSKSNNSRNVTEDGSEYEWEFVKVEEDKYKDESDSKSLIPQSRSSYLEIQRSEWRNDETHDYDNNINNYLLD